MYKSLIIYSFALFFVVSAFASENQKELPAETVRCEKRSTKISIWINDELIPILDKPSNDKVLKILPKIRSIKEVMNSCAINRKLLKMGDSSYKYYSKYLDIRDRLIDVEVSLEYRLKSSCNEKCPDLSFAKKSAIDARDIASK